MTCWEFVASSSPKVQGKLASCNMPHLQTQTRFRSLQKILNHWCHVTEPAGRWPLASAPLLIAGQGSETPHSAGRLSSHRVMDTSS